MIKVFIDASVIIAAILSSTGGSAKIIRLGRLGSFAQIISQTVIDEVYDHTEKIKKTKDQINQFIQSNNILVRKRIIASEVGYLKGLVDPTDAHLIAGANLTECDYLITLDKKHLLKETIRDRFKPLKIVNPEEFLKSNVYN